MPVRRYRKRAAKRARKMYGKKRTWKKRSRFTQADGYHKEKVSYTCPFRTDIIDGTQASFWVEWNHGMSLQQSLADGVYQAPGGTNNPNLQFQQCYTMYREYRIKGFKLKYTPRQIQAGSLQVIQTPILVGTRMNSITQSMPTISQIKAALDFKEYKPQTSWKRYYHVSKWTKSAQDYGGGWLKCADMMAASNQIMYDCQTGILSTNLVGLTANQTLGELEVTYYIDFRSRQPQAGSPAFMTAAAQFRDAMIAEEAKAG